MFLVTVELSTEAAEEVWGKEAIVIIAAVIINITAFKPLLHIKIPPIEGPTRGFKLQNPASETWRS
jgi:hypothetical protein